MVLLRIYSVFPMSILIALVSTPAYAREHPDDELKARLAVEAEAILKAEEGTWESVWETLNRQGEVVRTVKGVETFTPFNGSVRLLRTKVAGSDQENTAFRFYNPTDQKLYIIDVSSSGQHFILQEDVGSDTVTTDPFPTPRGGMARLRFTTIEKSENHRLVRHERSTDDGRTWHEFRRQWMQKVDD